MAWPRAIAEQVGDREAAAIGEGQSGAEIVRLRGAAGDLFLKIGRGHVSRLVAEEVDRLRWLDGRIPAARVVAAVSQDDAAWLLTTALPGVSAGDFIKADRSRAVPVARAMAAFLRRLHALPIDDCPYDSSLAAWLPVVRRLVADELVDPGLIDTGDFDDEHAGWSAGQVLAKVEDLAGHARGRVVVHGDYSLGNVIVADDGTIVGCVDVGRLGVGDPYRDIVIAWRDLGGFGAAAQHAFLDALGIGELDAARRELHRALDELF